MADAPLLSAPVDRSFRPTRCRPPQLGLVLYLLVQYLLMLGFGGEVRGQSSGARESLPSITVPTIDNASQTNLARAEALLESRQWSEAIDNVRAVMETTDQRLVEASLEPHVMAMGFERFVPVREHGHRWLAALARRAPEALDIYRDQVDPLAEQLFRTGVDQRDERKLRRVVDELFLSRSGDDALYWLGEFSRQRGDYLRARGYWERISPSFRFRFETPQGGDAYPLWMYASIEGVDAAIVASRKDYDAARNAWLAYPDTDRNLEQVRAALTIVSILEGHPKRAELERQIFERLAPDAIGTLAGRSDKLFQLVEQLSAGSQQWPPLPQDGQVRTFAGSPSRNDHHHRKIEWLGRLSWSHRFPRLSTIKPGEHAPRVRVAEGAGELLSLHPLVVGQRIILATGPVREDIEVLEASSGRVELERRPRPAAELVPQYPGSRGVPRLTLTSHAGSLFATTSDWGAATQMIAIDLQRDHKLSLAVELSEPDWPGRWVFEGPPLADHDTLYVALRRTDQVRPAMYVAGFSRSDGRLQWRTSVCEAEADLPVSGGYLSNLLTMRDGILYYNTNMGAVASLETSDGSLRWVVTYPRQLSTDGSADRNDLHFYRDLTPPLVSRDLVVIAARDCQRIFALDAATGALIWLTPPELAADAIHLLGVSNERLILSGECLYWFDIESGQLVGRYPSYFHAAPGYARPQPRGFGRGLLVGDEVYWPTRDAIFVFDQQTVKTDRGWRPKLVRRIDLKPLKATGGNLALADNLLLVAGADRLYAFEVAPQ